MDTRIKKGIVGIALAASIAGGGTLAADEVRDPYTEDVQKYEVTRTSVVHESGIVSAELLKEKPEVLLKRWDGEMMLSVAYPTVSALGSRQFLTDRIEWKDGEQEVHAYPLDVTEQMEDGGFEIEIILNSKPTTNVFDFVIGGYEHFDFFYQPALTQEEIDGGSIRPENIVGSYAVYHKEQKDHIEGETNYATGKVLHIFRPKAIDANGVETWAELSYAGGTLSVTVPQKFLDNATYPVRVDPTFGNTVLGASIFGQIAHTSADNSTMTGRHYALSDTGTLTSLHLGLDTNAASAQTLDLHAAVWREDSAAADSHDRVAQVERLNVVVGTAPAWYDFTAASEALVPDDYILSALGNGEDLVSLGVYPMYDTAGSDREYSETTTGAGSYNTRKAENPWTEVDAATTRQFSFYATYAVPSSPAKDPIIWFD